MSDSLVSDISLNHNTVQDAVTNRIRSLILTRTFKPGDRLIQKELAAQLGVSRTPVREALHQLATEGLVTISPYRGAAVVEFAPEELEGIYHVRIALEGYASRLATSHITDEEIAGLKGIMSEMRVAFQERDPELMLDCNRRFYLHFYRATRQQRLYDMIVSHLDLSRQYRRLYFYLDHLYVSTIAEHEELVEAIEARDLDRVEQSARSSLEATLRGLITSLQT